MRALSLLALSAAAGCWGPLGQPDAPVPPDAAEPPRRLSVASGVDPDDPTRPDPATIAEPDFSCVGTVVEYLGGPLAGTVAIIEFSSGQPAAGVSVSTHPGLQLDLEVECEGASGVTDAVGLLEMCLPGPGLFTLEIGPLRGTSSLDSYRHSLWVMDAVDTRALRAQNFGQAISEGSARALAIAAGLSPDPDDAIIAIIATDCADQALAGAELRLLDTSGTELENRPVYVGANLHPSSDQPGTHTIGAATFFVPDLESRTEVIVEVRGRGSDGRMRTVGCERLPVRAGAFSFRRIGPSRAGGEPCASL